MMPRRLMAKKWKAYSWPNCVDENSDSYQAPPPELIKPTTLINAQTLENVPNGEKSSLGVVAVPVNKKCGNGETPEQNVIDTIAVATYETNTTTNNNIQTQSESSTSTIVDISSLSFHPMEAVPTNSNRATGNINSGDQDDEEEIDVVGVVGDACHIGGVTKNLNTNETTSTSGICWGPSSPTVSY